MPELRDVLRQGADVTTGLPDMPAVWSRAVRERRRRRLATGAAVAAVIGVVAVLGSVIAPGRHHRSRPSLRGCRPPHPSPSSRDRCRPARPTTQPLRAFPTASLRQAPGGPWRPVSRGGCPSTAGRPGSTCSTGTGCTTRLRTRLLASARSPPTSSSWLTSHPRLRVGEARTITLAEQQWRVLDVSVRVAAVHVPARVRRRSVRAAGRRSGPRPSSSWPPNEPPSTCPSNSDDTTVILVAAPTSSSTAWTAATALVSSLHERPLP